MVAFLLTDVDKWNNMVRGGVSKTDVKVELYKVIETQYYEVDREFKELEHQYKLEEVRYSLYEK